MFYYIYKITNAVNNKIYIGVHETININDAYMGSGKLIKAAIKKYGIGNFSKEILEYFENSDSMYFREGELVTEAFIKDQNNYNMAPGGSGGSIKVNRKPFKQKHSEETKRKISESSKGKIVSEETKLKIQENLYKTRSYAQMCSDNKLAASQSKSLEHKLNLSKSLKGRKSPNKGIIREVIICPHCGKTGAANTMSRWHFDNCKDKDRRMGA